MSGELFLQIDIVNRDHLSSLMQDPCKVAIIINLKGRALHSKITTLDVNRFKVLIIEYKQSLNCLDNNVMGVIILHP